MLEKKLNEKHSTFNEVIPKIVIAEYGNDAGMIGASLI